MGLFGEAALGALLQEGPKQVISMIYKALKFKSTRRDLGSALEREIGVAQELKQRNTNLGRPEEEMGAFLEDLERAERTLDANSNVPCWQCCCLPWKQVKLREALDALTRSNTLLIPMLTSFAQETLLIVREGVHGKQLKNRFDPPPQPDHVVGLGLPDPLSLFNKLKTHLLETATSVTLLTGLAGHGKTTWATLLCSDVQVREKFGENILFLTVSKSPNLKTLVESLFQHYGCAMPDLDLADDRHVISHLKKLLEEIVTSPMMLVLDDVWPESQSLVDAFKVQHLSDYKILVTSRFNIAGIEPVFRMEPLRLDDSVTLLSHLALPNEGSSIDHGEKLVLIREIARGCYGSPLVLELVGGSLKRERLNVWRQKKKKLSKGHPIINSHNELQSIFKKYLDDLLEDKPILKECFMDLGLFPEDQKIPVAALIDIWTEQQNKSDDDDLEPRPKFKEADAVNIVFNLTDRHLTDLVMRREVATDLDDYCNHHFLMQHDLIREMIEASQGPYRERKRLVFDMNENNWSQQNQQNTIAHTLSISTCKMVTPELDNIVKAEVLEVLVLNLRTKKYTFPEIIRKMVELKVLIVTNYDDLYCSELNNFELLNSLSGLKRIRLERISVTTLGKWHKLRKLSLYNCNLNKVFESDNIPISGKLPSLVELCIDYCKDLVKLPAELCHITSIKKLSITRCMGFIALPQDIGNLVNLKTLRLSSCAVFEEVPTSIGKLLQLRFLDISGCVSLRSLPEDIGDLRNLERLHMIGCSSCKMPSLVMKLENLKYVRCDEETAEIWKADFKPSLPNLNIQEANDHNLFIFYDNI